MVGLVGSDLCVVPHYIYFHIHTCTPPLHGLDSFTFLCCWVYIFICSFTALFSTQIYTAPLYTTIFLHWPHTHLYITTVGFICTRTHLHGSHYFLYHSGTPLHSHCFLGLHCILLDIHCIRFTADHTYIYYRTYSHTTHRITIIMPACHTFCTAFLGFTYTHGLVHTHTCLTHCHPTTLLHCIHCTHTATHHLPSSAYSYSHLLHFLPHTFTRGFTVFLFLQFILCLSRYYFCACTGLDRLHISRFMGLHIYILFLHFCGPLTLPPFASSCPFYLVTHCSHTTFWVPFFSFTPHASTLCLVHIHTHCFLHYTFGSTPTFTIWFGSLHLTTYILPSTHWVPSFPVPCFWIGWTGPHHLPTHGSGIGPFSSCHTFGLDDLPTTPWFPTCPFRDSLVWIYYPGPVPLFLFLPRLDSVLRSAVASALFPFLPLPLFRYSPALH